MIILREISVILFFTGLLISILSYLLFLISYLSCRIQQGRGSHMHILQKLCPRTSEKGDLKEEIRLLKENYQQYLNCTER